MRDIVIIGCGVIGAACAYELSRYDLDITVLEASNDIANGTTKANSAIVHAGYDPHPGTAMAELNVEGNRMMDDLCRRLDVPFARVGSHVLAFSESELVTLEKLYDRGVSNGVPELRLISGEEAREMEPELSDGVVGSLYAPTAGIISPWELAIAMAEVAVRNRVELRLNCPVTSIRKLDGGFTVSTPDGEIIARLVINAAGVAADRVAQMVGDRSFEITPARGEYFLLDKSEGKRVSSVIFQCPNELGKGVLVSPTVHGNLIVGPDASPASDTSNTASGLAFIRSAAQKSVPGVDFRANIRNFAGVRANHSSDDFIISESAAAPGFFNLAGIKSPGLSAAPAIALKAVKYVESKLKLKLRSDFVDGRKVDRFKALDLDGRAALIKKDSRYGRIICRCEQITEGEIVAALHSPIPPTTVNGVKRRCGAGMGRCQGGFCGPRVLDIIARELGIPHEEVLMEEKGSYILTGRTKEDK